MNNKAMSYYHKHVKKRLVSRKMDHGNALYLLQKAIGLVEGIDVGSLQPVSRFIHP